MIVLDTNVISELMRSEPHPAVFAWAAAQTRASLLRQPGIDDGLRAAWRMPWMMISSSPAS